MPRTYSDSFENINNSALSTKSSGSLPYIFNSRKYSQLVKKVESKDTEFIHFIKHIPLRLTRTRLSCQVIGFKECTSCQIEKEQNTSVQRIGKEFSLFSNSSFQSHLVNKKDETSSPSSDALLTPFAQILSNLNLIRDNILEIGQQQSTHKRSYDAKNQKVANEFKNEINSKHSIDMKETCDTLDWCLKTLETAQTHRSISDLTAIKFQRILHEELKQNEKQKSDIEFCNYISETFIEKQFLNKESVIEETNFSKEDNSSKEINISILETKNCGKSLIIKKIESEIDVWGIDLFEIKELTDNVFTITVFLIFQKRQFLSKFNIPEETLFNFLISVEENYRNVPYHNSIHAADVTQSSHVILNSISQEDLFTDMEMLAVIFASAIHDVDHPGVSNQFLINTNDPLAILYNDHSVLENHHLATAFRLLREKKCDILSNINKEEKSNFRKLVIDMVLATDMSFHISLLADLKTMIETKKVVEAGLLNLDNYHNRIKIFQCLIHCSDLSNPTKPLLIYQKWVTRILEEFYNQGDKEREMGLDLSPMCDRLVSADGKTQVGFIDYIVYPLWNTWRELVTPDIENVIQNLDENRSFYFNRMNPVK